MSLYKAIIAIAADTNLDRDAMVINPWFNDRLSSDPTTLATDIANATVGAGKLVSGATQCKVSLYEVETPGAATGPPAAVYVKNPGSAAASTLFPRETAFCLSFYAGANTPRKRGRLYLPAPMMGLGSALRPSSTAQTKALDYADALSGIGGIDVDWVVMSKVSGTHAKVTHAWADDEWDTIRSRGFKPTSRMLRSVSG